MPRDQGNWAGKVEALTVGEVPAGAINLNVEGKRVVSPIQGFGKMWQKTYRIALGDTAAPAEVIARWKANFPSFWPTGNYFYGPITGIAPGEVAVINMSLGGGMKLSTGVLVLYADDESFTLMTPQGHMLAGWITFSSFGRDGQTIAQAEVLIRASDPLFELGLAFGGHRKEDRFWIATLTNLAAHFGVEAPVEVTVRCVDRRRQWRRLGNIRHNSAVRTGLYLAGGPFRLVARPFRRAKA